MTAWPTIRLRLCDFDNHLKLVRADDCPPRRHHNGGRNGSLTVTGLTPGTTHYFYPYRDDSALAPAWVGGLASGAGTDRIRKSHASV
jgi:hypothetical protein